MTTRIAESPLLRIQEAAQILHVHSNTLRRWTDKGIITAYRINPRGDRRVRREDIIRLLANILANGGYFGRCEQLPSAGKITAKSNDPNISHP